MREEFSEPARLAEVLTRQSAAGSRGGGRPSRELTVLTADAGYLESHSARSPREVYMITIPIRDDDLIPPFNG